MIEWLKQHPDAWLAIAGGAGGFLCRQIWRLYKAFQSLFTRVDTIHKQVHPNGGTSMADDVKDTKATVSKMSLRGARVEAMMRMQADTSNIPQFSTNASGSWDYANRAFTELTGRSADRLHGLNGLNAIAPADRQRVSDEWEEAVEQKRDFESDYSVIAADGSLVPVRCRAFVFRDEGTERFAGYTGRLEVLRR